MIHVALPPHDPPLQDAMLLHLATTNHALAAYATAVASMLSDHDVTARLYTWSLSQRQHVLNHFAVHQRFPTPLSAYLHYWTEQMARVDGWLATGETRISVETRQMWLAEETAELCNNFLGLVGGEGNLQTRIRPGDDEAGYLYQLLHHRSRLDALCTAYFTRFGTLLWADDITRIDRQLRLMMPTAWVKSLGSRHSADDLHRCGAPPEHWWWYREGYL